MTVAPSGPAVPTPAGCAPAGTTAATSISPPTIQGACNCPMGRWGRASATSNMSGFRRLRVLLAACLITRWVQPIGFDTNTSRADSQRRDHIKLASISEFHGRKENPEAGKPGRSITGDPIQRLDSFPCLRSPVKVMTMRTSALRHVIAALLLTVLTLAGVGRGLAVASDVAQAWQPIAGAAMPICHSGGPADPAPVHPVAPVDHDCCDQCALCAPAVVFAAPELRIVSPVSHGIVHSAVVAWTVRLSRARSPRQSQGPPAA